jgi:hypothetical protein
MIACLVNSRGFCVPKVEITGGERVVEMICAYISIRPRPGIDRDTAAFTSRRELLGTQQTLLLAQQIM